MLSAISCYRPEWLSNWMILGMTILVGYYNYATWEFRKFKKLGIKGPRPIPLMGNLIQLQRKGLFKFDLELKEKYGSVVGCFMGRMPVLTIFDISILKRILIKDFHLFTNRMERQFAEPPVSEMIIFLRDDQWRRVRSVLTPTFSSGKMRKMAPHLNKCCRTLCNNLSQKAENGEVFDLRELCGAYTMDVIASTAFGIEIDSHNDPKNDFVVKATELFRVRITFSAMLFMLCPHLFRLLYKFGLVSVMDRSVTQFFIEAVQKAMNEREKGAVESDFLQIMINAHLESLTAEHIDQKGEAEKRIQRGLTNDELLAQGFLFFVAGFETTANTLSAFGYNMATSPEAQERLYFEIFDKFGTEGEPNYDSVKELQYLEMCFCETLRMYPAGPRTDRVAAEDVEIDGLLIPKEMLILVPIYAIQNDPEYWDKPEVFNPERFHPSVRSSIEPLRYMPFGVGPRNCVGMRLAILELKIAIVKMMLQFKFVACKETEVPLVLDTFATKGKNGIKIKVEKRI